VSRLKHWGWGLEERQPAAADVRAAAALIAARTGVAVEEVEQPVALEEVSVRAPRIAAPAALESVLTAATYERARHSLGKSYCDVVRGMRGQFDDAPDLVARPGDERELEAVLEWCAGERIAVVPYGGGTSVVGGVTPEVGGDYAGVVSLDTGLLSGVRELDAVSRAARIGAGSLGPALERELGAQGMTLRFYPQSFEFSTLGGWVATRAGGHFATLRTHIDDLVESVRAITPAGAWESRRLPASGAGPSPDRLLLGSEGTLGVITEAWVRIRPRPTRRASRAVAFDDFLRAAECVRELAQSGLEPSNCRLLDAGEAALTGAGDDSQAKLIVGFESAEIDVEPALEQALAICAAHGGEPEPERGADGAAETWRGAFLDAPYLRDVLVMAGLLVETFESAVTWDRFAALHAAVGSAVETALAETGVAGGRVHCRLTHVYPDGAAPYFTVVAPAARGEEVAQWSHVKRAASDALVEAGGTITHHHAVGRDHVAWYERQRPELFARLLRAGRAELDPAQIMNPGVLGL
jgi:alkyldihydroxyacetonephosphate synthase